MAAGDKKKYAIGSVIAIPLPDGKFAFAKMHRGGDFGIYDVLSNKILDIKDIICNSILFFKSATDVAIKNGEWPVIGVDPFLTPESEWAPPQATCYIRETNEWTMGNIPRIEYKGEMRIATLDEVRGLDILSVSHRPELLVKVIIDRLINGNHENYKVRS